MSSEENKRIIAAGLERRKADRIAAEREAMLDSYEQDQLDAVHRNCEGARLSREADRSREAKYQERIARRQAQAAEAARRRELEVKSMDAVRCYGLSCMGTIWMVAVTELPFWAALALMAGLAVFPLAYIFRLYNPIGEVK